MIQTLALALRSFSNHASRRLCSDPAFQAYEDDARFLDLLLRVSSFIAPNAHQFPFLLIFIIHYFTLSRVDIGHC